MSSTEVGVAFVRLLPSLRGFTREARKGIESGMSGPTRQIGERAGRDMGGGVGDGLDRSHGRVSGAVGRLGGVVTAGLAGVGVVAGGLLAKGFADALELEDASAKLTAQLGGGEWAAEMGEVAANLYADAFGDSIADTSEAVRQVFQAGLFEDDASAAQIEELTARALTFSDVLDQDLTGSLRAVKNMIASGLAADAEEAFDILTVGFQQTGDLSGDLLDTFTEYSTQFREIGLTGQDAMGLLAQGGNAAARDLDVVADALKEFAILSKDGSDASMEAFRSLGFNADDMRARFISGGEGAREGLGMILDGLREVDQATREDVLVDLFGTKSEDLQAAFDALDLSSAASMMGDVSGASTDLGSAYDTLGNRIDRFKRGALLRLAGFVEDTVIPGLERLGGIVGPIFQDISESLGPVFDDIGDQASLFFNALTTGFTEDEGTPIESLALALRDLAGAASDLWDDAQPVFDFLTSNGEILTGVLAGLALVIGGVLTAALVGLVAPLIAAAAPFILVGAAIAGLVAGFLWLHENVEGFRNFVDATLPKIGELFSAVFELIRVVVTDVAEKAGQVWARWGDDILQVARIIGSTLGGIIQGGLDIVIGIVRTVTALIQGDWSGAWDGVKQILSGAARIIVSIISGFLRLAWLSVRRTLGMIGDFFSSKFSEIRTGLSNDLTRIVGFFRRLPGRIRTAVSNLAGAITAPFRSAFTGIRNLWNRTAGGFGFSLPSWIPGGIGGRSFSIPRMHTGGIVAGEGEVPIMARSGEGLFTRQQMAALAPITELQPAGSAPVIDAGGAERAFIEFLERIVEVKGGGSVQLAFGEVLPA